MATALHLKDAVQVGWRKANLDESDRLYPNRQQRERLQCALDVCRELYNAALQERRDAREQKVSINFLHPSQSAQRASCRWQPRVGKLFLLPGYSPPCEEDLPGVLSPSEAW